jgi:hypothetical protein
MGLRVKKASNDDYSPIDPYSPNLPMVKPSDWQYPDSNGDDLRPARGILLTVLLGLAFWSVMLGALWIIWRMI